MTGLVKNLTAKLVGKVRLLRIPVAYRSVTAATGVALLTVGDVVSGLIEMRGVFSRSAPALVWVENGRGASIAIALVQDGKGLGLLADDDFVVPLEGGITPETLVRFAVSELGDAAGALISVTLFADPDLDLDPRLADLDARFPGRAVSLRGQGWPQIFGRDYYYGQTGEPRRNCHAWAMGGETVALASKTALRGCNLFLRRCQIRTEEGEAMVQNG